MAAVAAQKKLKYLLWLRAKKPSFNL